MFNKNNKNYSKFLAGIISEEQYYNLIETATHRAFEKKIEATPNDQTTHRVYADWLEEHAPETVSQEVLDRLRNSTGPLHVGRDQHGQVMVANTHLPDDEMGTVGHFHSDLNNHIKKFVRSANYRLGWVVTYRPLKDADGHWYWTVDDSVSGDTPAEHPVKLPIGISADGPLDGDRIGPNTHERLEKTHIKS